MNLNLTLAMKEDNGVTEIFNANFDFDASSLDYSKNVVFRMERRWKRDVDFYPRESKICVDR